jgi:hypothetical protein
MRTIVRIIFVLSLFGTAHSQIQIGDLKPAHRKALEQFLSKNPGYQFLSEKALNARYLRGMRRGISGGKPFYNAADFNRDGIVDFASVLRRKGKPKDMGEEMAETHRYNYPLTIVIFNGDKRGNFNKAFITNIEAPLASFLDLEVTRRQKRLYFGVAETDDITYFTPAGRGYTVTYPEMP